MDYNFLDKDGTKYLVKKLKADVKEIYHLNITTTTETTNDDGDILGIQYNATSIEDMTGLTYDDIDGKTFLIESTLIQSVVSAYDKKDTLNINNGQFSLILSGESMGGAGLTVGFLRISNTWGFQPFLYITGNYVEPKRATLSVSDNSYQISLQTFGSEDKVLGLDYELVVFNEIEFNEKEFNVFGDSSFGLINVINNEYKLTPDCIYRLWFELSNGVYTGHISFKYSKSKHIDTSVPYELSSKLVNRRFINMPMVTSAKDLIGKSIQVYNTSDWGGTWIRGSSSVYFGPDENNAYDIYFWNVDDNKGTPFKDASGENNSVNIKDVYFQPNTSYTLNFVEIDGYYWCYVSTFNDYKYKITTNSSSTNTLISANQSYDVMTFTPPDDINGDGNSVYKIYITPNFVRGVSDGTVRVQFLDAPVSGSGSESIRREYLYQVSTSGNNYSNGTIILPFKMFYSKRKYIVRIIPSVDIYINKGVYSWDDEDPTFDVWVEEAGTLAT